MRKDPKTGHPLADPNLTNKDGMTALAYSLKTENQKIIEKLCFYTTENLDSYIKLLSQNKKICIGDKNGIEVFIQRLLKKENQPILLDKASFFGNKMLVKYLVYNNNIQWKKKEVEDALKNSILVDSADCVEIMKEFWQKRKNEGNILTEEMKSLAKPNLEFQILILIGIIFQNLRNMITLMS